MYLCGSSRKFSENAQNEEKKEILTEGSRAFELWCNAFHVVENGLEHRSRISNYRQVIDGISLRKELLDVWAVA